VKLCEPTRNDDPYLRAFLGAFNRASGSALEAEQMVAEIYGGIAALKTAFDVAKGLKDIHDATIRNVAIIELQEKILSAQAAQSALIDRVRELEQQVADFEKWETEKEKYELKCVAAGAFARMLKPEARGAEPAHWLCTQCYENRKTSVMQRFGNLGDRAGHKCPECGNSFTIGTSVVPIWLG
jgi:TctA family transporter